jgi:hypothetical protein
MSTPALKIRLTRKQRRSLRLHHGRYEALLTLPGQRRRYRVEIIQAPRQAVEMMNDDDPVRCMGAYSAQSQGIDPTGGRVLVWHPTNERHPARGWYWISTLTLVPSLIQRRSVVTP